MTPQVAAKTLTNMLGIDITPEHTTEAINELQAYHDLGFETIRGKYKVIGDYYIILAVQNTVLHNGAWGRYIDCLKASYQTVMVQSVVNKRLYKWFLRDGFKRTKNDNDSLIWRITR